MNEVENKFLPLKRLVYVIFLPLMVFALVIYVGNALLISEKIGSIFGKTAGVFVEVFLDAALIFLPVIAVAWQFKKNLFKYKTFCLERVLDRNADDAELHCFICSINSSILGKKSLESARKESRYNLEIAIKKYRDQAKEAVKKEILNTALLAAVSVVASPRSFGDAFCMLIWSCRVTNQVLSIYGFRPRGIALLKLYFNVVFSSMLVGSIEEVMDNFLPGEKIPFLSPVVQALAAAFAIFKAAHLTEYYLQHGVEVDHGEARKFASKSARESLKSLKDDDEFKSKSREIVGSGLNTLKDWFKGLVEELFKFKLFGNKNEPETN